MLPALAISAILGFAAASPAAAPQGNSLDSFKVKRAACDPQPPGAAPVPVPDTVAGFFSTVSYIIDAATAPLPSGYVQSFLAQQASASSAEYITYETLDSYDTQGCADFCNSVAACESFNIYVERDPSVEPGTGCPNPPSTINYKCALFGGAIDASNATNSGQYRDEFQVVITASNGYNKII